LSIVYLQNMVNKWTDSVDASGDAVLDAEETLAG
jgi:hypothetical protein